MSDKELIAVSVEKYALDTISKLFGISSLPAQALIKYAVRNQLDKYNKVIELFQDKDGKINVDMILGALKSEIRIRGGYSFMNVKFTESDVDELSRIIKTFREGNNVQS